MKLAATNSPVSKVVALKVNVVLLIKVDLVVGISLIVLERLPRVVNSMTAVAASTDISRKVASTVDVLSSKVTIKVSHSGRSVVEKTKTRVKVEKVAIDRADASPVNKPLDLAVAAMVREVTDDPKVATQVSAKARVTGANNVAKAAEDTNKDRAANDLVSVKVVADSARTMAKVVASSRTVAVATAVLPSARSRAGLLLVTRKRVGKLSR